MHLNDVKDPQLHALYEETIHSLEQNLHELMKYYPNAPTATRNNTGAELRLLKQLPLN